MRFPIDCPSDCPHLTEWDMSVDDYTYYCDVLKMQIDGCDCWFKSLLPLCPLEIMDVDHDYERASDMRDYCERYEPTYNHEDESM